jgi:hypothetical protein
MLTIIPDMTKLLHQPAGTDMAARLHEIPLNGSMK